MSYIVDRIDHKEDQTSLMNLETSNTQAQIIFNVCSTAISTLTGPLEHNLPGFSHTNPSGSGERTVTLRTKSIPIRSEQSPVITQVLRICCPGCFTFQYFAPLPKLR